MSPGTVRPWVRFWARFLDYTIASCGIGVPVTVMLFLLTSEAPNINARTVADIRLIELQAEIWWKMLSYVSAVLALFAWAFIEALLLSTWGTTPGKWLFRVSIISDSGDRLTYRRALGRSLLVYLKGVGLGLPLVSFITQIVAYFNLKHEGLSTCGGEWGQIYFSHVNGDRKITLQRRMVGSIYCRSL